MIARVWHGWTSASDAAAYETHFRTAVLSDLREVTGFMGAQLLRRDDGAEVAFVAVTTFASLDALRAFAGADYEMAVVTPHARRLLSRFDERCEHYTVAVAQDGTSES